MKKLIILILTLVSAIFIFSACAKYEDGPSLSLRTKKQRLKGTWEYSAGTANLYISLKKNGSGVAYFKIAVFKTEDNDLKWKFTNNKEKLNIYINFKPSTSELFKQYAEVEMTNIELDCDIIRLTNKDLWLRIANVKNTIDQILERPVGEDLYKFKKTD